MSVYVHVCVWERQRRKWERGGGEREGGHRDEFLEIPRRLVTIASEKYVYIKLLFV